MLAALASVTAIPASLAMRASKSCGCMVMGSTPSLASLSLTEELSIAFTISAWILATRSREVLFGTSAATQKSKSESGNPASTVVGTSGRAEARFELPTAKATSLPSAMNGNATGMGQN